MFRQQLPSFRSQISNDLVPSGGGGSGVPPQFIFVPLLVMASFGIKYFLSLAIKETPAYVAQYVARNPSVMPSPNTISSDGVEPKFVPKTGSQKLREITDQALSTKGFPVVGLRFNTNKKIIKTTVLQLMTLFPPSPPKRISPRPSFTVEEKAAYGVEGCEDDFEFCVGTSGTLAAGFSCGPAGSAIEFSADGEITLSASRDDMSRTIFVTGSFTDVEIQSSLFSTSGTKAIRAGNSTVRYDTVLDSHAFITEFNRHYKVTTCPVTSVDFCVTKDDPTIGFTYSCDGASTSVKLNGTMAISVSSNDGRNPIIEIGHQQ